MPIPAPELDGLRAISQGWGLDIGDGDLAIFKALIEGALGSWYYRCDIQESAKELLADVRRLDRALADNRRRCSQEPTQFAWIRLMSSTRFTPT